MTSDDLRVEFERVYGATVTVNPKDEQRTWVHVSSHNLRYLYDTDKTLDVLHTYADGHAMTESGELNVTTHLEETGAFLNQSEEV